MAGAITPGAGWRRDPYRRHELRYWDGLAWTPHVSDLGVLGHDPVFPVTEGSAAGTFLAPSRRRRRRRAPGRSARDLAAAWAIGGFFAVVALAAVTAHRAPEPVAARQARTADAATATAAGGGVAGRADAADRPRPVASATETTTTTVTTTSTATSTATRSAKGGPSPRRPGAPSQEHSGRSPRQAPRPGPAPAPHMYPGCAALNDVHPHGVGLPGARDRTAGRPVTNYTVDPNTYWLNMFLDVDHDGIVCERP